MKRKRRRIFVPNLYLAAALIESSDPQQAARLRRDYDDLVRIVKTFYPEYEISHRKRGRPTKPRPPAKPTGRPKEWDSDLLTRLHQVIESVRSDGSRGGKGMLRRAAIRKWVSREVNEFRLPPRKSCAERERRIRQIEKLLSRYAPAKQGPKVNLGIS